MLLWAGFDANAQEDNGMNALHYMTSLKNLPGSHPVLFGYCWTRASSESEKRNGDTALCYLLGNTNGTVSYEAAWLLLRNGADPFIEANDGPVHIRS